MGGTPGRPRKRPMDQVVSRRAGSSRLTATGYWLASVLAPRAVATRVHLGELGADEQDLRRVVDPQQQHYERRGGPVDRGATRPSEIEGDEGLPQREEERGHRRTEPHVPPVHGRVGQHLEDEGEEGADHEKGDQEVERWEQ